jgi:hypothetical protein
MMTGQLKADKRHEAMQALKFTLFSISAGLIQIAAFALLFLLALDLIFDLVPMVTAVEVVIALLALGLEVYGHFSLSKE